MPSDENRSPTRTVEHWLDVLRAMDYDDLGDPPFNRAVSGLTDCGLGAVPELIEAWADDTGLVSHGTRKAVQRLGVAAFPDILTAIRHPNPRIREDAIIAVYALSVGTSYVRPDLTEAIPELIEALKDEDVFVRQWAATTITDLAHFLGPALQGAVPNLIDTLQDEYESVREWSAKALGAIGPAADAAVPFLDRALADDVQGVRTEAAEALNAIDPPLDLNDYGADQ